MPANHRSDVRLETGPLKGSQLESELLVSQEQIMPETVSNDAATEDERYCMRGHNEKIFVVSLTSLGMILCMIATNIILPVIPVIATEYHLSPTLISLTITVYMLMQGISPALMSAISDLQGRRLAWILSLFLYFVSNIGLALQDSYIALMVLRSLQSIGSSCGIPFGFAVVADIASPAERGRYLGPMQGCVLAAFAFGPVIGGLLWEHSGWRSIFWFLAIASGSFLVVYTLVVPETARKVVGNGLVDPGIVHDSEGKDALILILYTSLLYFGISALWATTANHFGTTYGLNTLYVGLCFLPYGIAGGIGSIVSGKLIDVNYRRLSRSRANYREETAVKPKEIQDTGFPFEVARLQIAAPFMLLVAFAFVAYGWAMQKRLPLAISLFFQALIGLCANSLLGVIYVLLVDLFPEQAAATSGAADLVRCWLGALSAAVVDKMLSIMGWGWCFTLIALFMIGSLPLVGLVYLYGPFWRGRRNRSLEHDIR
ncbi:hypothetical protein N7481_001568 [Penicillium waksmanii]|uniref:uncharacterized protein n=1 Tax=Penicillium waksmanii TaxID=69791 RepID=UPI0025499D88|nr:uncharacterized protein N7481_001568 [Penicillium waksmanii]KAJ6001159.1 hypothetical protein N7481_001568 [Penicillium waksmanii]